MTKPQKRDLSVPLPVPRAQTVAEMLAEAPEPIEDPKTPLTDGKECRARNDGPMHTWFNLSYAAYMVLPRTIIQEMPVDWQERMVRLMDEADAKYGDQVIENNYVVQLRGDNGRFKDDPLRYYRRNSPIEPRV